MCAGRMPAFVDVVIVRGFEGWEEDVVVWAGWDEWDCWEEGEALPWIALCALNAARKLERKGRWVGMFASLFIEYSWYGSNASMANRVEFGIESWEEKAVDIAGLKYNSGARRLVPTSRFPLPRQHGGCT
jgi:hypothetical protein